VSVQFCIAIRILQQVEKLIHHQNRLHRSEAALLPKLLAAELQIWASTQTNHLREEQTKINLV